MKHILSWPLGIALVVWLVFATAARCQEPPNPSMWPVHFGVTLQIAGNTFDGLTSWKQAEQTRWLADQSGMYQGHFYRSGAAKKALLSSIIVAASYPIALRWPKTRKYVALVNGVLGATWTGVAVSNVVRNPYFRR